MFAGAIPKKCQQFIGNCHTGQNLPVSPYLHWIRIVIIELCHPLYDSPFLLTTLIWTYVSSSLNVLVIALTSFIFKKSTLAFLKLKGMHKWCPLPHSLFIYLLKGMEEFAGPSAVSKECPGICFPPTSCFPPQKAALEESCQHWEGTQADNQGIMYSPGMGTWSAASSICQIICFLYSTLPTAQCNTFLI